MHKCHFRILLESLALFALVSLVRYILPFTSEKLCYKYICSCPDEGSSSFLTMRTILIFTLANTMNVRRLMRSALAEGGKSTKVYSGRTEAESRVYYELTVSKERLHKKAMCVRSTILPPQPLRPQPLRPQTYSHTSSIWAPLGDMKDGTIRTASHNHETQEMRGPDKRFMSRL